MTQQEHGEEDEGKYVFSAFSVFLLLTNDDLKFFSLNVLYTEIN